MDTTNNIPGLFLIKSRVKAHSRKTKSGKMAQVREHTDSRTKKGRTSKDLPKGTEVVFKPEGAAKVRSGVIAGVGSKNYRIQGRRSSAGSTATYVLPKAEVISLKAFQKKGKKDTRYTKGDKINSNRIVTTEESRKRLEEGMKRLGMTEEAVLTNPRVKGYITSRVHRLAKMNNLDTQYDPSAEFIRVYDDDYSDLVAEYVSGMMNALRREASKAPDKDIQEFKDQLAGKVKFSRIFISMSREGKNSALQVIKVQNQRRKERMDLQTAEEDPGARRNLASLSTAPEHESLAGSPREKAIDRFLSKLSPFDADLISMKFGLGDMSPHTNEQIASNLKKKGSKYQDKDVWTRNNVAGVVQEALGRMRELGGIEGLMDYMKSMREVLDLRKSVQAGHKTICVDFDGVIADNSDGFQGTDIFGEPLPGAIDAMKRLQEFGFKLIIFTTRPDTPELRTYLNVHGIPYEAINNNPDQPEGANPGKPIADIYLDDRAVRFGNWQQAVAKIWSVTFKGLFGGMIDKLRGEEKSADCGLEKSLSDSFDGAKVHYLSKGIALVLPEGATLEKSYSSDLTKKHPGGKWITIKEGPLAGRHIFILPHADGTASVLSGGGPAMQHKVLGLKKKDGVKDKKKEEKKPEKKPEEKPEKKELSEEKRKDIETSRQKIKGDIKDERSKMADIVREHIGQEVEITDKERKAIEEKIGAIAEPKKKAISRLVEINKLQKEKNDLLHKVAEEAKKAIMEENPTAQGLPTINAVVKENAEDLLNHYYKIKAMERENKSLGKLLRADKDSLKAVADSVEFTPLSRADLADIISDEKARSAELEAHYKLMATTRGYVDEEGKEHKVRGGSKITSNIKQGGFETFTGIVGEVTGSSIISKDVYGELGSQNASVLAHYYLKNSGADIGKTSKKLAKYIESEGGGVAKLANDRGDRFREMAAKVRTFGKGDDNLMSQAQALGTSLKYQNKAYEAYGQAEGSLNQAAELTYEFANDKGYLEFHAGSRSTLDRKRQKLKLTKSEVNITRDGDKYNMKIASKSFEKMLKERPTNGHGPGEGPSVSDIKSLKANTDNFSPSMLREYTPEDANGESRRIILKPEQQAAARLIEKGKREYLNFEAGVGKSLAILGAKAHIEDVTGKPKKMIITMPQKLMTNFKDEVEKFSHYKVAIVNDATPAKRKAKYNSDPNTIVVVNKEKFNFDKFNIKEAGFDMVVADEAHKITQREGRSGSGMSQGLSDVAKDAEYYVAMSGTPTPSDLSELYFHANLMNPEKFNNQKAFMNKFGTAHKGVGLKDKIKAFMAHEMDDHVYTVKKQLDTKFTMHQHMAKLSGKQEEAYKKVSESFRTGNISPLQRDNQLNRILNATTHTENGKFNEIKTVIDKHLATRAKDEKVILYAKNYDTVGQIEDFLKTHYKDAGEAVHFTGRQKVKDIAESKQRFKHDPSVRFAIHTRAGVEGLNLQYDGNGGGATTAIAVASGEDSFAPLDQFFSRANRTGATKDINAHLVLTDTPHDMGTDLRLQEKKEIGGLLRNKEVRKSLAMAPRLFLLKKSRVPREERTIIEKFKKLDTPNVAESGYGFFVKWADGRGLYGLQKKIDAVAFAEQGGKEVVSMVYRKKEKGDIVHASFTPEKKHNNDESRKAAGNGKPIAIEKLREKGKQLKKSEAAPCQLTLFN
ncbi:DEAD/DEAH box helicase [Candidatus Pacearchaeota archaeon]|nr:DEAD/DEAH box helicase [Candidatus Pacearchaeota archaeon]